MKNIDDLIQQQFDNDDPKGRFEFREEYWEQALALIEADEARRRKKRRWLLWWCFAGLLLVSAGYGFWKTQSNTVLAKNEDQQDNAMVAAPNQDSRKDAVEIAAQSRESALLDNDRGTKEKKEAANLEQAKNNNSEEKSQGINWQNQKGGNYTTKNNATQNLLNNSQFAGNELSAAQQAGKTQTISRHSNSGKTPTNSASPQQPLLNSNAETTTADQQLAHQLLVDSSAGTTTEKALETNQSLKNLFAAIFALPLPIDTVSSNKTAVVTNPSPVTAPPLKQIKPLRDSRFSLGFGLATTAYQPAPDKRWLGVSGSIFTVYKLNESWTVCLGLALRYQPGNWRDTAGNIQTESLKYSFGFESLKTQRRALGLMSLETPMAVAWHRGALAAEAGVAPGRLLFALERYEEISESSLTAPKTTKNQLERGETSIYHPFYANVFAGLEWKLTQNASINVRGNYRFGAILKATPEDPSIKGGSNLELGLKWMIGL